MNRMQLRALILWVWAAMMSQPLMAQTGYPASFCDTTIEDFCKNFELATDLDPRYGIDEVCLDPLSSFPTTEGDSACTDEFLGYWVKLADTSFDGQLNGERSAWNHSSELAFFRGPNSSSITFFDANGEKIDDHAFTGTDFYTSPPGDWQDKLTEIRWHPTENVLFYPKEHQLIQRKITVSGSTVSLGFPQVIASFPGCTIGMSYGADHRIAGGDGNDVNAGRFLISLVRGATTYFVIYDFNEDALITQNIDATVTPPYSENTHAVSTFASHMFTLPQLDYAQVSASGLYIVALIKDGGTEQIELYDFDGNRYDVSNGPDGTGTGTRAFLLNRIPHTDATFVEVDSGVIRECIIVRSTNNSIPTSGHGDANALYWYINDGDGTKTIQWGQMKLMEWASGAANLGAVQYSAVPAYQDAQSDAFGNLISLPATFTYRMLACMREVTTDPTYFDHLASCSAWRRYFGEIVELSLTYRDSMKVFVPMSDSVWSTTPRRIVHHRVEAIEFVIDTVITTNPPDTTIVTKKFPILQPEAWISPDGKKMFFKSPDTSTADSLDENLYFIRLPERTCQTKRKAIGGTYRLAQQGDLLPSNSVRIYPNPISLGRSVWLELDANIPGFHGELILTDMSGRSQSAWQGMIATGQAQKISLLNLSPGMYVAELVDGAVVRHRQKILVR